MIRSETSLSVARTGASLVGRRVLTDSVHHIWVCRVVVRGVWGVSAHVEWILSVQRRVLLVLRGTAVLVVPRTLPVTC